MSTLYQRLRLVAAITIPVVLVGAAGLWLWRQGLESEKEEGIMKKSPRQLHANDTVEEELQGGETRSYQIFLEQGQFLDLVAEQQGIDVKLVFHGPGREHPVEIDSPNGDQGPERLVTVARGSGAHQLDVVSGNEKAKPGRFVLSVPPLALATEPQRRQAEAHETFAEGEGLRRQRTAATHRQAIEKYHRALALWEESADEAQQAEALRRLAWLHDDLGEQDSAWGYYERSCPLYQAAGDPGQAGRTLNEIGDLELRRGRTARALECFLSAREMARGIEDPALEAAALANLGNFHRARGETQAALDNYRAALDLRERLGHTLRRATTLHNLGTVLSQQGKLQAAIDVFQQSLELRRAHGDERPHYLASTLSQLGLAYVALGRREEAFARLDEALELRRGQGHAPGIARELNNLGLAHGLAGDYRAALESFQEALATLEGIAAPRDEATILLNTARASLETAEPRKALELFERSLALFQELGDRQGVASAHYGSARAQRELGELEAALERLDTALNLVEEQRTSSPNQDLRIAFFATKQHYFDLKIAILMQLEELDRGASPGNREGASVYAAQAVRTSERQRVRALLDVLGEAWDGFRRGVDPHLLTRERELQTELNRLERSIRASRRDGSNAAEGAADREAQRRNLVLELEDVRGKIRQQSARYARMVPPEPLNLEEIQGRVVGQNTLLLIYSLGQERSFLWCLPKEGAMTSYALPSRAEIEDAVTAVRELLPLRSRRMRRTRQRLLAELSEMLLAPARELIGRRRLVFVVEGALQALPFGALPDPLFGGGGDPLIRYHEIVYLPSVSLLAVLREELADRAEAELDIAIFADPVCDPEDPRLEAARTRGQDGARAETFPTRDRYDLRRSAGIAGIDPYERLTDSAREAEAIAGMIPPDMRRLALGFDANRGALFDEDLDRYKILHFATHGVLNQEQPELSGLVLSLFDRDGRPQDGFLYAHEIYNLDLAAELVVLSACQSGLGPNVRGEGLISLSRGFMYAGAPRVVVSLWQVSDKSTAELMRRFYDRVFNKNLAPAAALRRAQIAMLQEPEWSDPFHWAAFIYQGDWRLDVRDESDGPIEESSDGEGLIDEAGKDPDLPGIPELLTDDREIRIAQPVSQVNRADPPSSGTTRR